MSRTELERPTPTYSRQRLKVKTVDPKALGEPAKRKIWWSNAILFIAFHVVGLYAWIYHWPTTWRTWALCYLNWQVGTLGITIGLLDMKAS
jgi:fatty-acid desaturase